MKKTPWLPLVGLLVLSNALACGDDDTARVDGGEAPAACQTAADCDDGVYCNGEERCAPGAAGADRRGCVSGLMACGRGTACDETTRRCGAPCSTPDADGDGHDAIECGGDDCDDADPNRFPGNLEICDLENHDEDCDHATYGDRDLDGDGYHDARCCNEGPGSLLFCGEDCDDTRRGTNPNVPEVCDGRDNDCDGVVDEEVQVDGFADTDRDLYGSDVAPLSGCPGWPGISASMFDCDDTDPTINALQVEIFDGKDNDCDGLIDEDVQPVLWYWDVDGDGYGDSFARADAVASDRPVPNRSILPFDCDDADANRGPHVEERCNAIDDDCDANTQYMIGVNDSEDDDGDGYPDANCPASHLATNPSRPPDCDDTDPATYPHAPERCDGRDNDCDGVVDEGCSHAPAPMDGGVDGGSDAGPRDAGPPGPGDGGVDGGVGADAGAGPDSIVEVRPGLRHFCARSRQGRVLCWGSNPLGWLGDGTNEARAFPAPVAGPHVATALASGNVASCMIDSGNLSCWGNNYSGLLGDGTSMDRWSPTRVDSMVPAVAQVTLGYYHTCALDLDGHVWCWGANFLGQLGSTMSGIQRVADLSGVAEVVGGYQHTCVRRHEGTVQCWGRNADGELGNGLDTDSTTPVDVAGVEDAVELSTSARHTCARLASGSVMCWGSNRNLQLGVTGVTTSPDAVLVPGLDDARMVGAGTDHTCVLRADGSVVCWGTNARGQLGRGPGGGPTAVPAPVAGLTDVVFLASAGDVSCVIHDGARVACWGTTAERDVFESPTPVEIAFDL